jgi:histone H3/H4
MAKKKAAKKKTAAKGRAKTNTRGKKKAASRKKAKAPAMEMLLVGSKTKAALKAHGVNVASDAFDSLNGVIHWYLDQAAKRAAANGRKTVRGHDFVIM